jgi:hypothetical protein
LYTTFSSATSWLERHHYSEADESTKYHVKCLRLQKAKHLLEMLQHFRLVPFLVGLVIGYLVLAFYVPPKHTVYEYPHPQNVKNRVYRDKNGVCYRYNAEKVDCDRNEESLKAYPLQG